jgi:hypothetical protein
MVLIQPGQGLMGKPRAIGTGSRQWATKEKLKVLAMQPFASRLSGGRKDGNNPDTDEDG